MFGTERVFGLERDFSNPPQQHRQCRARGGRASPAARAAFVAGATWPVVPVFPWDAARLRSHAVRKLIDRAAPLKERGLIPL